MEAQLMVEGVGAWKSLDEMEEHLILDELLLMHEELARSKKNLLKMMAAVQGINMQDDDSGVDPHGGDLPEELLRAERAWKAEKEKNAAQKQFEGLGLGYTKK